MKTLSTMAMVVAFAGCLLGVHVSDPALAMEVNKPDYGFTLALPDRWSLNETNGYSKDEFGGSYQLGLNDREDSASVLLLAVDAQPEKHDDIDAWMQDVILSDEHKESLLTWYRSYVMKQKSMKFDSLTVSEGIIGTGQAAKIVAPANLKVGSEVAHLVFAYFPSQTGDRWFCIAVYNRTRHTPVDGDVLEILKGISLR